MEKKKNNPWYYYNNGVLIKKRKPAMPGDLALISRSFTINCIFTTVREVYIGGFHDTQGRYFQWHDVFKASEVLNELTDLRTKTKNNYLKIIDVYEYYIRREKIDPVKVDGFLS